ncbi:MAG: SipW-dependent-type signal peptide-containing protein [Clostridia bacterium]|nr:SipW-dependent-type signal peptide-containing protein [Clostridia bacterium]
MTNRKTTKRALISSLLALLVCCTMLVGTTFAWFTDGEFIKGNMIKAGTLDIELDKEVALFSISNKWEPGYTEYASDTLKNIGNLALKYTFSIENLVETDGLYNNVDSDGIANDAADGSRLAEVLEVYVGTTAADMVPANFLGTVADLAALDTFDINADFDTNGAIQFLLPGESKDIELIIHMMEEAGNEYMNDEITFDIAIVATQYTYEEDEWGNAYYDEDALYPAVTPIVATEDMTIDNVKIDVDDYEGAMDAIAVEAGNVTINGGSFNGGTTPLGGVGNTAVFATGNSTVTINDGYFTINGLAEGDTGHIDLIYASGNAKIEINGGFFEGADDTVWLLNCKDNTGARITVNAGTFVNWNPKTAETAPAGKIELKVKGTVTEVPQDNGDIWYVVA